MEYCDRIPDTILDFVKGKDEEDETVFLQNFHSSGENVEYIEDTQNVNR